MERSNNVRFYDTSSLLLIGEKLFENNTFFLISSITLNELEGIKNSSHKDVELKFSARYLLNLLERYNNYDVIIHRMEHENCIYDKGIIVNNDTLILSDAIAANNYKQYQDEIIFVTNDLSLKNIANLFFGQDSIESVEEEKDDYCGYLEINTNNELLQDFYSALNKNIFDLKRGEYLVLRDENQEVVDVRVWDGENHRYLKFNNFQSDWFGKIKPYDVYQKMLFDSFNNNVITMVKGPAGSGKTLASLGFLMYKLEKHEIDKIIVFCNTVATADSAKLGFYPGSKDEKLLDSQIGNLLISKFGGRDGVEKFMREDKLILLPMSDIRGYDTSGMRAGIYISEAQNLTKSLIKLALQRVGEDCICIIDGDIKGQVDMPQFNGDNNGMRRVSKVYRGTDVYGEVTLKNIYRSKIAEYAEKI